MAHKMRKKRNKKYTGVDAKVSAPKVLRVQAEERSRYKQWRLDNALKIKILLVSGGIVLFVLLIGSGVVGLLQR